MTLINFSHPITEVQRLQVQNMLACKFERIIQVKTQFDENAPFMPQVAALVESASLSSDEWQTLPLVVILPALGSIAGLVLAELHGRIGYFPSILRLRPVAGSAAIEYEVAEVIHLQEVRDQARMHR